MRAFSRRFALIIVRLVVMTMVMLIAGRLGFLDAQNGGADPKAAGHD